MRQLSASGQQAIDDIARRHGFSVEATLVMLDAVVRGNGSMAQFSHPEFGGSGQWMRGGMTMVGDMFNNQLKSWVDALCQDLSTLVDHQPSLLCRTGIESPPRGSTSAGAVNDRFGGSGFGDLFMPGARQADDNWPGELGAPNASGSQNGVRYAYFAGPRRLAVRTEGRTTVYDTLDHVIGGVSQQQSGRGTLSFTSQHGPVDITTLPVVSGAAAPAPPQPPSGDRAAERPRTPAALDAEAVFSAIERLAALKERGVLSEEEFSSKKAELLRRV